MALTTDASKISFIKDNVKNTLLDLIYPVGSYYTSNNSTSPASLFGGYWTQITDRFLYATNNTNTGGSNNAIVPYHTHSVSKQPTFTITGNVGDHGHPFEGGSSKHSHTFYGNKSGHQHYNDHFHNFLSKDGSQGHVAQNKNNWGYDATASLSGNKNAVAVNRNHKSGDLWNATRTKSLGEMNAAGEGNYLYDSWVEITPSGSLSEASVTSSGTVKKTKPTFTGSATRSQDVELNYAGTSGNTNNANMPAYRGVYCWYRYQ